ncbi:MAG TPA: hypothetical protein VFD39_03840 [Trueperaceae bacterium]|nr:hypothetical protein [Trueperaceae bacterium]
MLSCHAWTPVCDRARSCRPQEQELVQALITTRWDLVDRYQAEIDAAIEPALLVVDAAVKQVAEQFSVSFVFDLNAARESDFVVFADPAIDLTSVVAEAMSLE